MESLHGNYTLSDTLRSLLGENLLVPNEVGHSGSSVFQIKDYQGRSAYLKISPSTWDLTLVPEKSAMEWLRGKFPIPEVLHFEQYNGYDFLVMSAILGLDSSSVEILSNPESFIKIYAESLRELHQLDITNCPLDQTLHNRFLDIERRLREGLVDMDDLEEEYQMLTAQEIYEQLLLQRPKDEDLVFTHGDYCLPNLIVNQERLSGFIDLGRAGIADRYQDIALAIRSMKHNLKGWNNDEHYVTLFAQYYGLEQLDVEKVAYYILLDEMY